MYRRPDRLIIAQYEAPASISVLAAAELLGEGKRAIAAQVVDLAVRRVISIGRPIGKGTRSGFTITVIGDASAEGADERAVLSALFDGSLPTEGQSMRVAPGRNRRLGETLRRPHRMAVARLVTDGLAAERNLLLKLLQPWRKQPVAPTPLAYPLVDQLWGVRDYIELAEQQRFAMLQSPEGATRSPLGQLDILRLHERLLPYAVLFGLEKQWSRELDLRMSELSPEILDGATVLDLADIVGTTVDFVIDIGEIGDIVSAGDSLNGVGAIFGGIAEFLGSLGP